MLTNIIDYSQTDPSIGSLNTVYNITPDQDVESGDTPVQRETISLTGSTGTTTTVTAVVDD